MPLYESTFIARHDMSTQQVEGLAESFTTIIKENGGEVTKTESWGLKSLAYRIKKNRKGHFVFFNLDAPPAAVHEYERNLRLNEDILRYLTVRVDELDPEPSVMMQARASRDERSRRGGGRPRDGESQGGQPKPDAKVSADSQPKPDAKESADSQPKSDAKVSADGQTETAATDAAEPADDAPASSDDTPESSGRHAGEFGRHAEEFGRHAEEFGRHAGEFWRCARRVGR